MSTEVVDALIFDLLEWIGPAPRPYVEVLEVWRTSCPRLTVWEDAVQGGLVATRPEPGQGLCVSLTEAGRRHLATRRGPATRASR